MRCQGGSLVWTVNYEERWDRAISGRRRFAPEALPPQERSQVPVLLQSGQQVRPAQDLAPPDMDRADGPGSG
jgi:hypothetical protein